MSLRDRNKGTTTTSLIATGNPIGKGGSLRKASTTAIHKPTGQGLDAVRSAVRTTGLSGGGNLGFVFDATSSRGHVWDTAKEAFQQMFRNFGSKSSANIRFMDFGNEGDIVDRNWTSDVESLCNAVQEVSCRVGVTQINPCLQKFAQEKDGMIPNSIIYVGDHYEETEADLEETISIMRQNNIKVFPFLDSNCPNAERMYRHLAESTGGIFAMFNDPSTPLNDLCEGVLRLTVGGTNALQQLENAAVKQLLLPAPKV